MIDTEEVVGTFEYWNINHSSYDEIFFSKVKEGEWYYRVKMDMVEEGVLCILSGVASKQSPEIGKLALHRETQILDRATEEILWKYQDICVGVGTYGVCGIALRDRDIPLPGDLWSSDEEKDLIRISKKHGLKIVRDRFAAFIEFTPDDLRWGEFNFHLIGPSSWEGGIPGELSIRMSLGCSYWNCYTFGYTLRGELEMDGCLLARTVEGIETLTAEPTKIIVPSLFKEAGEKIRGMEEKLKRIYPCGSRG